MGGRRRDESREAKKFAVVLVVALVLLVGYLLFRGRAVAASACAVAAVGIFGLAFFAREQWLRLFRHWMKLAEGISFVMTRVILAVVFYGFLTPLGLIVRIAGKRPLDLTFKDGKKSYWIEKPEGEYTLERYRRQY